MKPPNGRCQGVWYGTAHPQNWPPSPGGTHPLLGPPLKRNQDQRFELGLSIRDFAYIGIQTRLLQSIPQVFHSCKVSFRVKRHWIWLCSPNIRGVSAAYGGLDSALHTAGRHTVRANPIGVAVETRTTLDVNPPQKKHLRGYRNISHHMFAPYSANSMG